MSLSSEDSIFVSVITQGELLAGVERTKGERRQPELRQLYAGLIGNVADMLAVTERYAKVFTQLLRDGKPAPSNDIWIAATALHLDLIIVTGDVHFRYVEGLQVEDWSVPSP